MSEPSYATIEESMNGIYLGKTQIYKIPFFLDVAMLTSPHITIAGMTGSGKTFMLKNFIVRNSIYNKTNILVIDLNGEYKDAIHKAGGIIYKVGENVKINLFEFLDYNQDKALDSILEIIEMSTKITKNEAAIIYDAALKIIKNRKKINLKKLISNLDNTKGELKLRLKQLLNSAVFADKTSFAIRTLFEGVTSIDLSMLRSDLEKNFVSYILIRLISESLNEIPIELKINKFILLDEAWKSVDNVYLSRLFREGRKYGFGVVIATQLLSDINNVVISNSSCIVIFKLQNTNDFNILENTGIANKDEIEHILNFNVGECFLYLSFKKDNNRLKKFFIKKIDGLPFHSYKIYTRDKMEIEISNEKFESITQKLINSNELKLKIRQFISENDGKIDLVVFLKFLIESNIQRVEIISYLKQIGLNDIVIIKAYEKIANISIEVDEQ